MNALMARVCAPWGVTDVLLGDLVTSYHVAVYQASETIVLLIKWTLLTAQMDNIASHVVLSKQLSPFPDLVLNSEFDKSKDKINVEL